MSVEVVTFGCRLNAAESEVIRREALRAGLSDTVVVNTCAVTAEAVRQAAQTIRKLKRENPGAHLIVSGCAAQIEPESFAAMAEVDLVLGNDEKLHEACYGVAGFLGESGKILLDLDDNRFLVPDIEALPAKEQELFLRYVYW